MRREAAISLVEETLEQPFDRERFARFTKELLNRVDDASPFVYRGNLIFDDFKEYVESLERIAKYQDADENKLEILIVRLKRASSVERARTAQRQFIAKYLKGSRGGELKDAALVAFVSPDEDDWRFSYVRMEYKIGETPTGRVRVKEEFTPARRYSFLVGKHENSHTAQSRLLPILEDSQRNPSLSDIEDAFSVEKVTKEFFEKYRELYLEIKETLDAVVKKDKAVRSDFADKGIESADFAKKLLGQIVFLYFLQKKGWFGVARNAAWGSGPKNFLRRLCSGEIVKYENFFNDVLEPLFYEALATERPADWYNEFKCKIPFLNGGLFDPLNDYDWIHTDVLLSNDLFTNREKTRQGDIGTGILDVFERYNFTVKEDEPLEKEVAVDPEMLGKVFENLLDVKDRKSKGTYYTPRDIVHYMCEESLINYLAADLKESIPREGVELLIRHGEAAIENDALVKERGEERGRYRYKMPDSVRTNAELLDRRLQDIKVCDPAVGSGAFLVGMMTEIVKARAVLSEFLSIQADRSAYSLKRHAIQSSLYGVDIDPSAVEVAKLRLWLSLIVDEDDYKQIKPLPNLDYKIMQGNSLFESYDGIKLIDERFFKKQEAKEVAASRLKEQQTSLQRDYVQLHGSGKLSVTKKTEIERMLKAIDRQLQELDRPTSIKQSPFDLFGTSEIQSKAERLLELHESFFSTYNKRQKDEVRKQIDSLTWDLIAATLERDGKTDKRRDIDKFKATKVRPFFLWRLNFAEVFGGRGGFDVIIANPPYVRHEAIKDDKPTLRAEGFECFTGTADLLVYFFERGTKLLRPGGSIVLITSNKFYRAAYGEKLRGFLTRELTLQRLIDFGDAPVFEAIAYASILEGVRTVPDDDARVLTHTWQPGMPFSRIAQVVQQYGQCIQQRDLTAVGWRLESPHVLRLLEKVRNAGTPLIQYVGGRFYYGIKTGLNEAFVVDKATRDRLVRQSKTSATVLRPLLRGRDVKRWRVNFDERYLIAIESSENKEHPWSDKSGREAEKVFAASLPAINQHFQSLREIKLENPDARGCRNKLQQLKSRDDQGRFYWELRSCVYWEEFDHTKIMIPAIASNVEYALDCDNFLSNDKTTICVTREGEYLLGLLNSRVLWWFIRHTAASRQGGFYEFKPMYVGALPIPQAQPDEKRKLEQLVKRIIDLKQLNRVADVSAIEHEIDQVAFEIFKLTADEVAILAERDT